MTEARKRVQTTATAVIVLLCGLSVSGCTYMCHGYDYVEPTVDGGAWRITGRTSRHYPASWQNPPGSWGHWRPDEEDRYQLTLTPVAADTTYWLHGDVAITGARILAGADTVIIAWAEIVDLYEKGKTRTDYHGNPIPHWLRYGKRRFESDYFLLPHPVPDTLVIEFDLDLIDVEKGELRARRPVRTEAVIDRHRRWDIADMSES